MQYLLTEAEHDNLVSRELLDDSRRKEARASRFARLCLAAALDVLDVNALKNLKDRALYLRRREDTLKPIGDGLDQPFTKEEAITL